MLDLMIPAVALPWSPIVSFPGPGRACFWHSVRLSATSSRKTVYSTVDDGRTWRTAEDFPTAGWLINIQFVDENDGYLAATNGGGPNPLIYKTSDSGAHWVRLDLPVPPGVDPSVIRDVQTFLPGFSAGGEKGSLRAKVHVGDGQYLDVVYDTPDSGATWTAVPR